MARARSAPGPTASARTSSTVVARAIATGPSGVRVAHQARPACRWIVGSPAPRESGPSVRRRSSGPSSGQVIVGIARMLPRFRSGHARRNDPARRSTARSPDDHAGDEHLSGGRRPSDVAASPARQESREALGLLGNLVPCSGPDRDGRCERDDRRTGAVGFHGPCPSHIPIDRERRQEVTVLRADDILGDVLAKNTQPMIVEVSYCYVPESVYNCPGHWDRQLNWHEGHMWPEDAILIDLLEEVGRRKSSRSPSVCGFVSIGL